jgi:chorismate mutase/prephenate dehydratase
MAMRGALYVQPPPRAEARSYTPRMATTADLAALREAIETLDRRLLELLRERMGLAERVAAAKLEQASPLRDRPREEHVLQRVRHFAVELGIAAHEIERLYRLIMEMSVARQQGYLAGLDTLPLRVAYQGVEGSNSHLAAQRRYAGRAGGALLSGCETFRAAADAVRAGAADLALLPIENSTAGSINETYDLLAEGGLAITAEVVSRVEHCLLGLPGATVDGLREVLSHPQALRQCEGFLRTIPWAAPREEFDTAGAARKVREAGDATAGAIASETAARLFGLEILRRGVQDVALNFTRFVEVANHPLPCPPGAACKTSLLLATAHRPGALGEVLGELGRRGINLTKLESRPAPGAAWRYRFYLDLQGHAASAPIAEALERIRPLVSELRVLGTYPQAAEDAPDASV